MTKFTRTRFVLLLGVATFVGSVCLVRAQDTVKTAQRQERDNAANRVGKEQEKIAQNSNVVINGATAFKEDELRSQLKEQIAAISQLGLTPARADDAAFLLQLYYRKNGFEKADVHYTISGSRLRLSIFLNVFDVHVNRVPVGGGVTVCEFRKGEFMNAMNAQPGLRFKPAVRVENARPDLVDAIPFTGWARRKFAVEP